MITALPGFNSRAREGRDHQEPKTRGRKPGFNSRAREGRDSGKGYALGTALVSTHAPARGAT